ncbi:beta-ketoacyl-[acyl-carrier-protein] synthase family protein [uncultured Azohydromonas sp.]|jgi:3-oxoacyl-(acyl-carrier-protein) synthase|uniref:beta-ketoacyl-[acyl-carrier-protein] synthase family protein n=1 Tax=uncultured Azohydromonas sp. TaxID=487342 RepID=UPI002624DBEB|nr:beta-ketoacyl-[acyl-carrier-protein] synthase family protein [uncultured Azohydromonas sp.]
MTPLPITDYTAASALGVGREATLSTLRAGRGGLSAQHFETAALETWIGQVEGLDGAPLPAELAEWACRNNRLAWLGLQADGFAQSVARAARRWGSRRVGLFLGTSTSAILETELAYRHRDPETGALPSSFRYEQTHSTASVAAFARRALGLEGPAFVVSTACSSSAKVFANAQRLIALGLIDAAVVGGVDSLCLTTLYGFNSLELLSREPCRPWDAERRGLSIGEAGAFALLERESDAPAAWLLGCGESSDGYHMSSPHPEGLGAIAAMRGALAQAGLRPEGVDYVNLHGTATSNNDAAEDAAVRAVFGTGLPCSSTKGATGHTLGAAGALEAVICMLALRHGFMPGGLNRLSPDPALQCNYLDANREAALSVVASNSFGFGGSNACLLLGAAR